MYRVIFFVSIFTSLLADNERNHVVQKRQVVFNIPNILTNPQFFQFNGQIPLTFNQVTSSRCQSLTTQPAPDGCFYVPVLADSNSLPLNCQLQCQNPAAFPFQLLPVLGQLSSIVPDYLQNNRFSILDQSNNDIFTGDSFFLFTPPTTTTTAPVVVTTTTAVASGTVTSTTPTAVTPPTPTPAATPVPVVPVQLTPAQLIDTCLNSGQTVPAGCSFNGNGMQPPLLFCGVTCAQSDVVMAPCDATGLPQIDQCLCQNKKVSPPGKGCTYRLTNSMPLTCPQLCPANFPGGG